MHTTIWEQAIIFWIAGIITVCVLWSAWRADVKKWDGSDEEHLFEEQPLWGVPSMANKALTMDYMVGDLTGQSNHDAYKGDVVIFLHIDSMGMMVDRDTRGRVTSSTLQRQTGEVYNPAFDSWPVVMEDGSDAKVNRYELRPCGLAPRTWVVSR